MAQLERDLAELSATLEEEWLHADAELSKAKQQLATERSEHEKTVRGLQALLLRLKVDVDDSGSLPAAQNAVKEHAREIAGFLANRGAAIHARAKR